MINGFVISGIQQVGIGIPNVQEAFKWYRTHFGMDIKIFEEAASAELMLPYTGNKSRERHAILAMNLQGGGGFEIWQYTSRTPQPPEFQIQPGDLGIYAVRLKTRNVQATYNHYKEKGLNIPGTLYSDPSGRSHFFIKDPYGNVFNIVDGKHWYLNTGDYTSGPAGCMIGVSNMDNTMAFYKKVLGYDEVIYDSEGTFEDLSILSGGTQSYRRVLVTHSMARQGHFSKLFNKSHLEFIQILDGSPRKIFQDRLWGDLGFIHLCYDITGMAGLKQLCEDVGCPFTVDSANSFDMGEAAGHFSYVEDPDGTLIEFVETHRLPLSKKLGWYLNLKKRDPRKALPDWLVRSLRFNRVKA